LSSQDPSVALLSRLTFEQPISYETLLNDQKLLERLETIDNLSALLYRVVAQGFAQIATTYAENGEEKISVQLTSLGRAFLALKKTASAVGLDESLG
jgi:hypothetical protein